MQGLPNSISRADSIERVNCLGNRCRPFSDARGPHRRRLHGPLPRCRVMEPQQPTLPTLCHFHGLLFARQMLDKPNAATQCKLGPPGQTDIQCNAVDPASTPASSRGLNGNHHDERSRTEFWGRDRGFKTRPACHSDCRSLVPGKMETSNSLCHAVWSCPTWSTR
jgi:hypothetical protein